ncbi:sigma-E processing peptidase SpoIIGA [Sporosarcina limicola]|uniref:Stage II sporulation protein GA (Sporulation sigma-E factor processing peptidase) n=1 Tax=Sporosarcina limicola TaxID=34101 RepID=A0A927MF23_9BACL|nr:sigma-E processing peptidase SpoIIGA [Sporosarcina limicola]MBE1553549.1 stage II sporulation protein GA (sporulation sigma-E factor processing peptidase) [Sporosarcina limicola]
MYGELIIVLNMLFNYAILLFANKVGNVETTRRRLVFASFVGSVPVTLFPTSFVAIIASFFGMTMSAFGKAFEPWRKSATMVVIGAVFAGGLLTALQFRINLTNSTLTVLSYALVAYVALFLMKRKWLDVRTARSVSSLRASSILRIWNSEIEVDVFVDSGNGCTEPLSGAPVHFVSFDKVLKYLPGDLVEPLLAWDHCGSPMMTKFPSAYHKEIRLIRLLTVQGQSWAVGFKFEEWTIVDGGKLQPGYIVLTKNDRRYPDGAEAILHVSAMESTIEEGGKVHAA